MERLLFNLTKIHKIEIGTGKIKIILIHPEDLSSNLVILVPIVWMRWLWLYIQCGILQASNNAH